MFGDIASRLNCVAKKDLTWIPSSSFEDYLRMFVPAQIDDSTPSPDHPPEADEHKDNTSPAEDGEPKPDFF